VLGDNFLGIGEWISQSIWWQAWVWSVQWLWSVQCQGGCSGD